MTKVFGKTDSVPRVLHLGKYYPPDYGGVEAVSAMTVSALRGRSLQRVVVFGKSSVSSTPSSAVRIIRKATRFRFKSQDISFSYVSEALRQWFAWRPDVVYVHLPNALVLPVVVLGALFRRARIVLHWHSDVIEKGALYAVVRPIERIAVRLSNTIVVTSPRYTERSQPLQYSLPKVTVVPNSIDQNQFRSACPLPVDTSPFDYTVSFVGRFATYKGLPVLVNAIGVIAKQYPELYARTAFILAGPSGDDWPEVSRLARRHQDNVFVTGEISTCEKTRLFQVSSVFVLPSISRAESFGIAMAEAMYFGVPVICFSIPGSGVSFVNLDGVTGKVVQEVSAPALADAIVSLLNDHERRRSYGHKGRERVNELFLSERFAETIRKTILPAS